jgi:SAM-dependent methyltransferase
MELAAYASMRESEDEHWWFVGRRKVLRSIIGRIGTLPPQAAVLEAGCGSGGNLPMLASYGDLHAFEYNDQARTYAARRTSGPVAFGALPEAVGFGDKQFDLIALLDVLEHIDDDLGSLVALRDRLTDKGSLLITVPAVPALWSDHDVLHHHKRRYSKAQLQRRLAEAGLVIERIGYFNTLLFPLALLQRLASKLGAGPTDSSAMPPAALNRILASVFSWESKLLGWLSFPIGLSLYAVVRRPASRA